jgi:hypothetical protein
MSIKRSSTDNIVKVQSDIRDGIDQARLKRYLLEQKKSEEAEAALANLSDFVYEPVDYTPGLVRKIFTEPPTPDFTYLLTEARLKTVNKYYPTIFIQLSLGLFFIILSLAFRDSFIPIIGIAGLMACTLSLHKDLQTRKKDIDKSLSEAREQIDLRVKEIRENIDSARKAFDEAEDKRIEKIEKLLNGDLGAIFESSEDVLQHLRLPFPLRSIVDWYGNDLVITLKLPDLTVIPTNLVSINSSGNINYDEKSPLEINRQYTEAMASAAVKMLLLLYAAIPTLDNVYIQGIIDRTETTDCLFTFKSNRQKADEVAQCAGGIDALRVLEAAFEVKTSGAFLPVQPILPSWWEKTPKEKIKSMNVLAGHIGRPA